jgi:hypothetical protein
VERGCRTRAYTAGPRLRRDHASSAANTTAHSLFRRALRIAGDGLLDLREQRLRIADKQIADVFAVLKFRLRKVDRGSEPCRPRIEPSID